MTRLVPFISLALLATFIPGGFAGPACSRKHWKTADCVQRCKSKWGWSGTMMGSDPWGSVMQKSDSKQAWDAALSKACGSEPTKASSTPPVVNVQTGPVTFSSTSSVISASPVESSTPSTVVLSSVSPEPSISEATSSSVKPLTTTFSQKVIVTSTVSKSQETPAFAPSPSIATTTRAPPPVQTTPAPKPTSTSVVKAPQPTNTPSQGSAGGSSGVSTSNSDIQAYLAGHNSIRSLHGAADLTWSDNLAAKAQQWADGCQFKHSGGTLGAFGENLAAGTGSYSIQSAIKSWTDEISQYNSANPVASHFTQVVWKATTQVGCAVQSCDGIFDASFGKAKYYVCEYSPAGNVEGQFAQNVQV